MAKGINDACLSFGFPKGDRGVEILRFSICTAMKFFKIS